MVRGLEFFVHNSSGIVYGFLIPSVQSLAKNTGN